MKGADQEMLILWKLHFFKHKSLKGERFDISEPRLPVPVTNKINDKLADPDRIVLLDKVDKLLGDRHILTQGAASHHGQSERSLVED